MDKTVLQLQRKRITDNLSDMCPARVEQNGSKPFEIIDIIDLFKMPELTRTLPGFALIKKKQLLDVRKGFKWEQNNFYYLMPDGSFSETAENEKFADFKITHMKYFLRNDPEKKMSLMIVLCKNPQLCQDQNVFSTHLLTQFYHEFEQQASKNNKIRCVDNFEELIKFLGEFTETKKVSNSKRPLTKALQALTESKMGPHVKYDLSQVRSSEMKTCDVIPYFTKPELLDKCPEISLLEKKQLNDTLNKFRCNNNHTSYLMPDGSVSRLGKDKESAYFTIKKDYYVSKEDVNIKLFVTRVSSNNSQHHHKNFDSHVITQLYKAEIKQVKTKVPLIKNGAIRSLKTDLLFSLKDDYVRTYTTHIPITKRDKSQKYVHCKKNPTAKIEYSEYTHSVESDIKAITTKITPLFDSFELKKLENKTFIQVSSIKKQKLFYLADILERMKTFQEANEDFSIVNSSDIGSDNNLKQTQVDKKKHYTRTPEGFKKIEILQDNTLPIDLVCQKYQFEAEIEPNIKYYAFKIHQTTDKELEQFVGKALVQKVDERHQIVTKPNDIIKYMMSDVV